MKGDETMGGYEIENIAFYEVDGESACPDCISEIELENITQNEIFLDEMFRDMAESIFFFCDRCNKRIT